MTCFAQLAVLRTASPTVIVRFVDIKSLHPFAESKWFIVLFTSINNKSSSDLEFHLQTLPGHMSESCHWHH